MVDARQVELLKAKLDRIANKGDEATLAFLTTLLTCGGYTHRYYDGFSGYITQWGERTFNEVKKNLLEEGVISEKEECLGVNLPGLEELDYKGQEELARDLSDFLFQKGWPFYQKVLKEVLATSEGHYIVSELAKAGPHLDEGDIGHVLKAVGYSYYEPVKGLLERAGLFADVGYGGTHTDYRFSPPLCNIFKMIENSPLAKEALAFIYIAQNVRFGVTTKDCQRYGEITGPLIVAKYIEDSYWYYLHLFSTTPPGDAVAHQVIMERVEKSRTILENVLQKTPPRILQFLVTEVIERRSDTMNVKRPDLGFDEWGFGDVSRGQQRHLCLLNNDWVRMWRNQLLEILVGNGLAVKVHDYVSTRGGELREERFVIAPEAEAFIKDYLKGKGLLPLKSPLFPEQLELRHRLWHFFHKDYISWGSLMEHGLTKTSVVSALEELADSGVIAFNPSDLTYSITDQAAYRRVILSKYFQPLVDYLLSEAPPSPIQPPISTPAPTPPPTPPTSPIEPPAPIALRVPLGKTEAGEDYYWEPLKEPNPHLLLVGSPGVGKTQTAKAVVFHLRKQGVPAFIVDFENEYGADNLVGLVLRPGADVTVNPLDLLEGDPKTVKFMVSGILKKIYRLGDQQEALLRQAIAGAYESAGIIEGDKSTWGKPVPQFEIIRERLASVTEGKGQMATRTQAVINRLEPIFELEVFGGKTQIAFEEILRRGATVFLRTLPTEETKRAAAEFFLRWLWHRVLKEGEVQNKLRLIVVLDEAHKLAYENSPVADLLRRGRKYGVAVLLSTQQPDDFESKELVFQNTAFHMAFWCNSERHARTMAREMLGGDEVYREIRALKPFEAIIYKERVVKKLMVTPYYKLASHAA
ncbi:MAG: type IV secretion system DNA-binding domain-containing protein [Candidatus Methanomethylicaceae archaeon]